MLPDTFVTISLSAATSGSALSMGSAISSTGRIPAIESAILVSDEKAPMTMP